MFWKSAKLPTYLLVYFDSWEMLFPDFRDFLSKCYIFAYFDNVSATFSKRAEFYPQNLQYSLGNISVCSFFDFHSHLAELVVFTMPDLVFLVKFAKMLRGCSFG